MSKELSAREAIEKIAAAIPGWDSSDVTVEELKGGLSNRTYRVININEHFVLRLDAAHTRAFNLDRESEIRIITSAATAGIAAPIVFADPAAGILLSKYLPGKVWSCAELHDAVCIDSLCQLLRQVHALPLAGVRFDPLALARRYAGNLRGSRGLKTFALRCEKIISREPPTTSFCCCHNDVIAANIIATPRLKLLDWEYACDNDPLFDLASLICFHDLSQVRAEALLDAYAGAADAALRERLRSQVRVYDAIYWLWLANRQRLTRSRQQVTRLRVLQERIG